MEKERYKVRVSDDLCFVGVFDLQENKYVVNESVICLDTAHLLCDLFNKVDKQVSRIKELEKENQKANINNYLTDYYLVEKENQQLKIENETLKEKISTQLQNNADNVDFMENQRKEIERLKEKLKDIKNNYRRQIDSLLIARLNLFKQLKQSQNKKAIEELEKVNAILTDIIIEITEDEFDLNKLYYLEPISAIFRQKIDNQIKDLEGKVYEIKKN